MSDLNIAEFGPCACPIRNGGTIVPHWRSLVESKYLSHFELQGRECNVRIKSVRLSEVVGAGGKKSKKALIMFEGKEKGMVAGVTVLKTIAGIYGDETDRWSGQWITLYPTTTEASGQTVGTVRVRPKAPSANGKQNQPEPPPEPPEDRGDAPTDDELRAGGR